jgi:adenylate cyclase
MIPISANSSLERLEKLIKLRTEPSADKATIDEKIWNFFGEEWAVVFTDLSGFSRRVAEFGIIHFLQTIFESLRICVPIVEDHDGMVLKVEGDSMLLAFRKPEDAVTCAVAMQRALRTENEKLSDAEKILLCVGIGFGKVLRVGDTDLFGAEVNAASKLGEDAAKAGEILVTGNVKRALGQKFEFDALSVIPPGADSAFKLKY